MNAFVVCMQIVLAVAGGTQDLGKWIGKDIGDVKVPGTARYNGEAMIWIIRGSGIDIFGTADSFQYVHQPFRGDGSIIARVESLGKTDPWAKAGVMIRESLDPGSRFAAIYASVLHGASVQARARTAGAAASDTAGKTKEQETLKPPFWIKLERRGNQFRGFYATDPAGKDWKATVWGPQTVPMGKAVFIGLAVCSHAPGALCETRFSSVTVSATGSEITDAEILTNPKGALAKAYENLEQLGNWRADPEVLKKHGNIIAGSLFTIVRIRELNNEPASAILPDYYRIAEILPEASSTVEALTRIAILDQQKGFEYARKRLDTRPPEERDRFYVGVMKEYIRRPDTSERGVVFESFVEYVAKSSRFTSLEELIADLGPDEHGTTVCQSLIQHGMAQPANAQVAIVALRYMALKMPKAQADNRIPTLLKWAATQFKDTKLSSCAMAALADTYYAEGLYAKTVEAFQPDLFAENQPEPKIVESIEIVLASYRANTLLQATINPERIYAALGEKAGKSNQHVVHLHCQRKIAEMRGLSVEGFEKSALKGVKYCDSGPENEVWFWKGLIAAGEGDLTTATAAYERFLQGDGKSILAAQAYYDIARAKMAIGEDAKVWIAKAKALSPCDAVLQLEQRSGLVAAARG